MKQKLKIGDILYRRKGLVEHVGAYFGDDQVIHNSPSGNVQLCSLAHFSEGKDVKVVASGLSAFQEQQFLQRAKEKLGQQRRYNFISVNCEQLVSEILSGTPSSPQVQGALLGCIAGTLLAQSVSSKHPFWLATAAAIVGCAVTNSNRKYDYVL